MSAPLVSWRLCIGDTPVPTCTLDTVTDDITDPTQYVKLTGGLRRDLFWLLKACDNESGESKLTQRTVMPTKFWANNTITRIRDAITSLRGIRKANQIKVDKTGKALHL